MTPELKERWIAALESGQYPQAQKALRTPAGYCCLGVLCEISGQGEWIAVDSPTGELEKDFIFRTLLGDDSETSLPTGVLPLEDEQEMGGPDDEDEDQPTSYLSPQAALIRMNDRGATFAEIAKWIRENL